MIAHPIKTMKRDLGAYYTPKQLGSLLAKFGLRSESDELLEPSFGGAGLLSEAITCLRDLGCKNPTSQIYGCDIDSYAFENLPNIVGRRFGRPGRRFVKADFLSPNTGVFPIKKFDVVLANPPYIGYRHMTECQRNWGNEIKEHFGLKGSRYASSWYYFLLKSLRLLKENGRIAFVLPYALVDSDYAISLRSFIGEHFDKSAIFAFSERLFLDQGTRERVVVLVAEGWRPNNPKDGRLEAVQVSCIDDFDIKLSEFLEGNITTRYLGSSIGSIKGRISNSDVNTLNFLKSNCSVRKISDFLDIKIGLVAGDVNYFTFNLEKIKQYDFDSFKHTAPVMRSLKNNPGLDFDKKDLELNIKNGDSTYLLKYDEGLLSDNNYLKYLALFDPVKIEENKTLNSREVWCEVDDGLIPDVFLAYMNINGPRIVINKCKVNCFNNTHRGYFKTNTSKTTKKLFAISVLTSFSKAVAELESKQYGSKTLKMEPKTYTELPVLLPNNCNHYEVTKAYNRIDSLLRENSWSAASDLASKFIYGHLFSGDEFEKVTEAVKFIRDNLEAERRWPHK